jgi:phosphoglycolate phosphatase-like HAD superfamily hydrolase
MIKAIVFDFDGVILDTYEDHYQISTRRFKGLTREMHRALFDGNIFETKGSLAVQDESVDVPILGGEMILASNVEPHIAETLRGLVADCPLYIISSNREGILNQFLQRNDLDMFTHVMGSETHLKKDVKFQMLFDKYNLKPEEVVFVTDTLGDILEANKVGVKSIGVDFGFHEMERLQRGNPYEIISDFRMISDVVSRLP